MMVEDNSIRGEKEEKEGVKSMLKAAAAAAAVSLRGVARGE